MRTAISPRLAIRTFRIIWPEVRSQKSEVRSQKSEKTTIIIIDCRRDRSLDNGAVVSCNLFDTKRKLKLGDRQRSKVATRAARIHLQTRRAGISARPSKLIARINLS